MAEAGQVVLHPAGPVATVTAVDEVGAFQEDPCPSHHWCFLSNIKILFCYTCHCRCCFRGSTQLGQPVYMQVYTDKLSLRPVDIQTQIGVKKSLKNLENLVFLFLFCFILFSVKIM